MPLHQFRDQAVPEPTIRHILEAGRLTVSGGNRQPWQFIVVQNRETLRQFGTLVKIGPYIAQAAHPLDSSVVIPFQIGSAE